MATWKQFIGSGEQLDEMRLAKNGWIVRKKDKSESGVFHGDVPLFYTNDTVDEYLICDPHPHAAMIKRWVETGQPVYFRHQYISDERVFVSDPSWNPKWEYSFNLPKEKEFIEVRDYLTRDAADGTYRKRVAHKGVSCIDDKSPNFHRWIDDDWRKIEI